MNDKNDKKENKPNEPFSFSKNSSTLAKRRRIATVVLLLFFLSASVLFLFLANKSESQSRKLYTLYTAVDQLSTDADRILRQMSQNVVTASPSHREMLALTYAFRDSIYKFQLLTSEFSALTREHHLDEIIYQGINLTEKLENIYSNTNALSDLETLIISDWVYEKGDEHQASKEELEIHNKLLNILFIVSNQNKYYKINKTNLSDFSSSIEALNQRLFTIKDPVYQQKMKILIPQMALIITRYWQYHIDLVDVLNHSFYDYAEQQEERLNQKKVKMFESIYIDKALGFSSLILFFASLLGSYYLFYIGYLTEKKSDLPHFAFKQNVDLFQQTERQEAMGAKRAIAFHYLNPVRIQLQIGDDFELIELALELFIDKHQHSLSLLTRQMIKNEKEEILKLLNDWILAADHIAAEPLTQILTQVRDNFKRNNELSSEELSDIKESLKRTIHEIKTYQLYLRIKESNPQIIHSSDAS